MNADARCPAYTSYTTDASPRWPLAHASETKPGAMTANAPAGYLRPGGSTSCRPLLRRPLSLRALCTGCLLG